MPAHQWTTVISPPHPLVQAKTACCPVGRPSGCLCGGLGSLMVPWHWQSKDQNLTLGGCDETRRNGTALQHTHKSIGE